MKRTKVGNIENNIIYVEPNYVFSTEEYGINGLNTYEFAPPLEDYSIFVNLEVEVRGRNVQSSKSSNNRKLILSFVTNTDGSSAVNFMQGSKIPIGEKGASINSLTTNYTDIFLGDLKRNGPSTETFGIQSIDISYNSYMVPEVTIEFIDVRGVALFAQKEYYETNKNIDEAINSNNKEDIANTFFQCFFTFPYPKFTILVKGFYGQPVSYELTCADFRARFDSKTGNFACTAKFVGYHFSFLNDVMMNGIVAAPYSDYIGASYWEERNFKLIGNSGQEVNLPKIGWLLNKMKDIEANAIKMAQSDPAAQEKIELDNKTNRYQNIESAYNKFVNEIDRLVLEKNEREDLYYRVNTDNGALRGAVMLTPTENGKEFRVHFADISGQIKGVYDRLESLLDEYNNEFPNEKLPKPDRFYDSTPSLRITDQGNDGTKATMYIKGNEDIKNDYKNLFDAFKKGVDDGNLQGYNPLLDYRSVYYYKDNKFASTLEEYKKNNAEKTTDVEKKIEKIVDTAISEALGFHPTVENMTRIVMAHFETFARMIFKTAQIICDEKPSRTIRSLGVSDARDINDVPNKGGSYDIVVPPFPKVVTEVKRENSTIREESWVGDYPGDFREKDLVHGIINGVKEVAKDIATYESTGDTPSYGGSETSKNAVMRFPLSPIDMVADSNPYLSGGYDPNDVSSLLGLVALRAINIFGMTNFKDWDSNAKTIGVAEAYNFLDDHKLSKEMLQKLSNISGGDVVSMLQGNSNGLIKRPGDGTKPWPWSLEVNIGKDGIIASNGDLNACRVKAEKNANGTEVDGFSVPYQSLSWTNYKNEVLSFNGNKAAWSNNYINSKGYANLTKNNIFTFDTNISRFSAIAEDQLKGLDGIDVYQTKFTNECKYDKEKYEKILKNADNVISYVIENASSIVPSDGSCMLPTSKNVFSNKSFEHGYNLDYFNDEYPGEGSSGQWWWKDGWKDKDGNEVKRKASDGYEKYLDVLNSREFTFTEFPGVNNDLSILTRGLSSSPANSIFGELLYYKQKSKKDKALLFLASLGYAFDYKKIIEDYITNDDVTMCIIPLPAIMFIGALLWSDTEKSIVKHYNTNYYKESLELLNNLRGDVKRRFIEIFENWVFDGVENDSLLRSFDEMREGLELSFEHKDRTYSDFFRLIPEIEDKGLFGNSRSGKLRYLNESYDSIMDLLKGELKDDFFRNYITIDEDVCGSSEDFTRGIRLGNRDGGPSSVHAINFALAGCVFSKNSKYFKNNSNTNVNVNIGTLESFFDGFLEKIHEENIYENNETNSQISQAKEPDDSNTDIKIGIYRYCKMIYDKWLAGLTDEEFEEQWTMKSFFSGEDKYFYFIDAFYNITDFIPINIGDFCDQIVSCYRDDQFSLLSFLSSVYAKNKFNFLCVQNFIDLGKRENMEKMFDTVPYTENWSIKRHPNFIVMYPYESSNYLDIENGEYENDGFLINQPNSVRNKWPEPLTSRNANSSIRYSIPAFGVSYGKMYQSYFKDIDISMDNPTVTEQSIKAQFAIACQNNTGEQTGDRAKLYTYGQDLYSIYSNNSYTCNVTMMGCAWIQPLMYFVLNNIPMFRGTYLIEKVTHHIEPGNMITKFMGVRMSNVCTRIAREEAIRERNNQTGNGEANGTYTSVREKMASVDNDCPYKEYPLTFDEGYLELSEDVASNANQIMKAIMLRGYTKAQAAGIVGNMQVESPGLNPKTVVCDTSGYLSGGLCMWHKHSLAALINRDPKNVSQVVHGEGYPCDSTDKNEISANLPDGAYQVKFLLDSLEENSYLLINRNVKPLLEAESSPEGAAAVFADKFEACGGCSNTNSKTVKERMKNARMFYDNYSEPNAPKIEKNSDNHISDLANGFLHALNKTAAASSNSVEIGIDSKKSNGDTIWLTNAKNSSDFSSVLDMILSAYSEKVSNINWILPGDGQTQNSIPSAYLVTVKEGSKSVNIKVTSENYPNTEIKPKGSNAAGIHISKGNDNGGIHQHFCKALVKAYKSPTEELKKDTNNNIDDYNALFIDEKYKLQNCNEAMANAGLIEGSTGGEENETGYIGDWNVGLFVQKLYYWQANICEKREDGKRKNRVSRKKICSPHSEDCGCGWCTGAVNRALRDSGFGDKYWAEFPWQVYEKMKSENSDFVEVRGAQSVTNKTEFQLGKINKGDICVMWSKDKSTHFHTCAYDGSNWYSDFKQNSCNVYRSSNACSMEWHLFRHK